MAIPAGLARWRKDPGVNATILLSCAASLLLLLALLNVVMPTDRSGDRGQLLYWALLIPGALWSGSLTNFNATAVRWLPRASVAMLLMALALAAAAQGGPVRGDAFFATLFASLAGLGAALGWALSRRADYARFVADANALPRRS